MLPNDESTVDLDRKGPQIRLIKPAEETESDKIKKIISMYAQPAS